MDLLSLRDPANIILAVDDDGFLLITIQPAQPSSLILAEREVQGGNLKGELKSDKKENTCLRFQGRMHTQN